MCSTGFYAAMQEHKQNLRDRRNRGEMVGDHRGTQVSRPADWLTRDLDELELAIARSVESMAAARRAFVEDLAWIVLTINDPTVIECPF